MGGDKSSPSAVLDNIYVWERCVWENVFYEAFLYGKDPWALWLSAQDVEGNVGSANLGLI